VPKQFKRRAAAALLAWGLAASALAADLTPVNRLEPEFPREAISAGADKGRVKARMTVDASGEVTRVEILDAAPRRLFERVVVKTLSQWKFAPGAADRSMEIDIDFHR
jgi:protein TonB